MIKLHSCILNEKKLTKNNFPVLIPSQLEWYQVLPGLL